MAWTKSSESITKRGSKSNKRGAATGAPMGLENYGRPAAYPGGEHELEELEDLDEEGALGGSTEDNGGDMEEAGGEEEDEEEMDDLEELHLNKDLSENRCDVLWQGILPKKTFHTLRFQECRSAAGARKVLEARGVAHYWDMAMRADEILASESISY